MNILVVAPSWIGDTIMAQPLLTRLKRAMPAARIEVLAPAWSGPLLQRMPEVDAVIDNPFAHGQFRWQARRALGLSLRGKYQIAYVLPNTWKSALIPFFANISARIGYHGEARWGLLNQRHQLDVERHPRLVERYAALAGPQVGDETLTNPALNSSLAQQAEARRQLGLPDAGAPVVFCPGAEYGPAKRWPIEHFAALAKSIAERVDAGGTATPVWLLGSAKDAAVGEAIVAGSGGSAVNLCGRSSLLQAIDLIAGARAVISNDSGLMHVAAALDRPMLALYGSSSPGYTPPLSAQAKILNRELKCSPCFKRECPLGHFDCLQGMSPDFVADQLQILLKSTIQ
jgi:heptosyltransferase-2